MNNWIYKTAILVCFVTESEFQPVARFDINLNPSGVTSLLLKMLCQALNLERDH